MLCLKPLATCRSPTALKRPDRSKQNLFVVSQILFFSLNKCKRTNKKLEIATVMALLYDYRNQLFGGIHISRFGATSLVKIIKSKETKKSLGSL